jgi:5,10-methenyltetrahydrofolate synthetase
LLADREQFVSGPEAVAAHQALAGHLVRLLSDIEPEQLGIYWPVQSEFNAISALDAVATPKLPWALPFARRQPVEMHYRAWDGRAPMGVDECGLPAPTGGIEVVPDVVLVPCVGFTRSGFRLGYGGGYFDRWLARHPEVTAIGVAWSLGEIDDAAFAPQAHDMHLMVLLTEHGVVAPAV